MRSHNERFDRESAYLVYILWIAIVLCGEMDIPFECVVFWLGEAMIFKTIKTGRFRVFIVFFFCVMITDALGSKKPLGSSLSDFLFSFFFFFFFIKNLIKNKINSKQSNILF